MSEQEANDVPDDGRPHIADDGLSLEDLGAAYAQLVQGDDPYADPDQPSADSEGAVPGDVDSEDPDEADYGDLTPRGIVEAMLFVGDPSGDGLSSQQIASQMRGVRTAEVEEIVDELNESYESTGSPYRIVSAKAGFAIQLLPEFSNLRDKFYGKVREAKLSQSAVDVLSIVAYRQPVTREEVDALRGKPSAGLLSQLVRRQLLRVERPEQKPRIPSYFTTERFLHLFGLDAVEQLPRSEQPDKSF